MIKKIMLGTGVVLLCVSSFYLGQSVDRNKNDFDSHEVYINGIEVEVVDFMYKYKVNNEEIYGDYSLVSKKGYEFSHDSDYAKEYYNANISTQVDKRWFQK